VIDQLRALKARAIEELETARDTAPLEPWRTRYLGRRGELTHVLRGLGALPAEERPRAGQAANEVKAELEAAFEARRGELEAAARRDELEHERVDVTLPGRAPRVGFEHILSQTVSEIAEIFASMGFQIAFGPEVEWDYYNFEALNIPKDHPARDRWDTIYVGEAGRPGEVVLRTHTSPNQIRVMEKTRPPVRVIVPGKCFRYEAVDATHEWMFYQVEGLAVDERLTMADMKGTLTAFVRRIFGPKRKLRLRCDFFPFVEPGAEVGIDCHLCGGVGCGLCKHTGWIEIMGAGMVHPKVLENVGYDSTVYSGFAFGMGPERIAMLKHGIDDIRQFYANDLRFLRLFR
jgi:phenylalanyl-tRNA synthetase alpha chain